MTTEPVKKLNKKLKKRTYINVALIMILLLIAIAFTMFYNIGPQNEMSCFYKGVENPTYGEMVDFIRFDDTDENIYSEDYKCADYSIEVIKNAKEKGIQAGFVSIKSISRESGHAIVCFKTTDRGLYFLEPQNDHYFKEVEMKTMLNEGVYHAEDERGTFVDIVMEDYMINWYVGIL
jgi:hypothetical protein